MLPRSLFRSAHFRHSSSFRSSCFFSSEEKSTTLFYLRRLLACEDMLVDKQFMEAFCECCPKGMEILLKLTEKLKLTKPTKEENKDKKIQKILLQQEHSFRTDDSDDQIEYISFRLAQHPTAMNVFKNTLRLFLESSENPEDRPARYVTARSLIHSLFSLSDEEIDFCEFLISLNEFSSMDNYFNDVLCIRMGLGRRALCQLFTQDEKKLNQMLKHLREADIIDIDNTDGEIRISEAIQQFWRTPDLEELEKQFLGAAPEKVHPLDQYRLSDRDVRHISNLLTSFKADDPDQPPVNILLYGPPGTGKSTFAASLARHLGMRLIVPTDPDKRTYDRRSRLKISCSLAHSLASKGEKVLLLMDEADSILSTENFQDFLCSIMSSGDSARGHSRERFWINNILEHAQIPIIWITNDVCQMDKSVMRRFAYSLEFPEADEATRINQWQYLVEKGNLESLMPPRVIRDLARNFDIPVGVMSDAISHCQRLYHDRPADFAFGLCHTCASFEKLCQRGMKVEVKAPQGKMPTYYNPNAICLKGGATGVSTLLRRLQNADKRLRSDAAVDAASCTMLFYGPPGTGKSALACWLAEKLKRDVTMVHASDILDKYVGGSENRIASAFQNVEESGKILIFDEVDSFLQNRQTGQRNWEITQVNEFLTRLENFHGIAICTTNNLDQLDAAALRRFAAKLEFTWLNPESCISLYDAMLGKLASRRGKKLSEGGRERLARLASRDPGLTPGDFKTVRNIFMFEDAKDCTEDRLLKALENELDIKSAGRKKTISGFNG